MSLGKLVRNVKNWTLCPGRAIFQQSKMPGVAGLPVNMCNMVELDLYQRRDITDLPHIWQNWDAANELVSVWETLFPLRLVVKQTRVTVLIMAVCCVYVWGCGHTFLSTEHWSHLFLYLQPVSTTMTARWKHTPLRLFHVSETFGTSPNLPSWPPQRQLSLPSSPLHPLS